MLRWTRVADSWPELRLVVRARTHLDRGPEAKYQGRQSGEALECGPRHPVDATEKSTLRQVSVNSEHTYLQGWASLPYRFQYKRK